MLEVISLQSGSEGNCTYVKGGDTAVLVDAGLSARRLGELLDEFNIDPRSIAGILITHEHWDHVGGAGSLHRKFNIPVYITEKTYLESKQQLKKVDDISTFTNNSTFQIDDLTVESVQTNHDVVDGCAFCFEYGKARFGIFTDMGTVNTGIQAALQNLDAMIFETNYDPHLLEHGSYPDHLKRRIAGDFGHLSNEQAADCLAEHAGDRLKKLFLGHLSRENNLPNLAFKTVYTKLNALDRFKHLKYVMTYRKKSTGIHTIVS